MEFTIGQVEGVADYVTAQVACLCTRLELCGSDGSELTRLFVDALEANAAVMRENLEKPEVDPMPQSRALWDQLGELVVTPESKLIHPEHLQAGFDHMATGGNVLVVQNHTSGADTLVWDVLVNRFFESKPATQFAYIAGHVVNLFLIPLVVSAAARRFQIFSNKYAALGEMFGLDAQKMRAQNRRAIMALARYVQPGGKCVGLYPEGGRGEGQLKYGDPKTAKIPEIISRRSDKGLMVLPTYVQGATSILPVHRGPNEFNEFIEYAGRGTATVTCGKPVMWETGLRDEGQMHARIMGMLAALAPTAYAKGPWAEGACS